MNKPTKAVTTGGISFTGLLQIVFIVLKLCNVITWKWVLVMLPLIISASITFLIIIATIIILVITNR